MKSELTVVLRQLPSVERFLTQIRLNLEQGYSVLVVVAQAQAPALWQICHEQLWQMNLDVDEVNISEVAAENHPIQTLSQRFSIELAPATHLPILTLMDANLPEVTIVRGLEETTCAGRRQWLDFFRDWSIAAHMASSTTKLRKPRLWGLWAIDEQSVLPEEEVWLRVHWWWSFPSAMEIRLLCRLRDGLGHPELSAHMAWREAIMPALAGNDLDLVTSLWDVLHQPQDNVWQVLLDFASLRGWSESKLKRLGTDKFLQKLQGRSRRFLQLPSGEEKTLWLYGILQQTPEHGLQISAAALAVLQYWEQLEHLLWRGQAALLLPVIDEFRLSICQNFTQRYGPNWPLQWGQSISEDVRRAVSNNPLATEWGQLENAVRRCPYRHEQYHLSSIVLARQIRNKLAHYQTVTYEDFKQLLTYMA